MVFPLFSIQMMRIARVQSTEQSGIKGIKIPFATTLNDVNVKSEF